ncbi:MAG TPA: metal-dependent hydrolase, partial [Candidatus Dormibacteraeota bacterium]|nr:metal-dependent hydrolase [Candidatus Dormibacteraeota bacterium]
MLPETHLLASWVIGAKATNNARDCRLVALAGILPDADGLGLLIDGINRASNRRTFFYEHYHHYLLHGA